MSKRACWIAALAASALALACDATSETARPDSRAPAVDSGPAPVADVGVGVRPDTGGSALRDAGPGPVADTAVPPADQGEPGLSCAEILKCRENCPPDQACFDDCLAQGSPTAQQQHAALASCVKGALTGSCSASCSDVASTACSACWNAACKAEIDTCSPS